MPNAIELPPEAANALAHGKTLRAIKLLREATGLSLKDAKDVVDVAAREQRGARVLGRITGVDRAPSGFVLPPEAAEAVAQGKFIEAIAMLRGSNPQLDLKSAQDAIDDSLHPPSESVSPPARAKRQAHASSGRVPTVMPGDSGGSPWLLALVLVALGAVLAWWLAGGA